MSSSPGAGAEPLLRSLAPVAESLWQALHAAHPDFNVELLGEIDSTNTELMRRARDGIHARTLLVAARQTAGRGRLGRTWSSGPEASLTFSLAWPLAPRDWSGLSLAVGLSVARSLHPRIALKWPNDLWIDDRKLGGILIETAPITHDAAMPAGLAPRLAVIGIGLNIALPDAQGLTQPAAALRECWAQADAAAALGRVLPPLVAALTRFEAQGFAPLVDAYGERDALRGREVLCSDGQGGLAIGVAPDGALCLQTAGRVRRISSAEVSVRPRG